MWPMPADPIARSDPALHLGTPSTWVRRAAVLVALLTCTAACASRAPASPDVAPETVLEMTDGALRAAMRSSNPRDETFRLTVWSTRQDGEEAYRVELSTSRAEGHGNGPLAHSTGPDFHDSGDTITARYRTYDRAGRSRHDTRKTIAAP